MLHEALPTRAFVIYLGVWVPLLFVEIADEDVPALEEIFGADALHEMTSIEFELARAIDVCLTHAQRLLERRPNGLVGRGGPKRAIDWTGYPALHADGQIRPTAGVELMTPQCHFVALNLSKQDDPANELDPGSPVPVATKVAAQQVLVVVAAGNEGEQEGLTDTSSPWARPDWVVSVGASDNEDGKHIAPYSGTGPGVPDFVAWGRTGLDDEVTGTSFATPRVTRQVLVLAAALHALWRAIQVECGENVGGVPLVGELMVDTLRQAGAILNCQYRRIHSWRLIRRPWPTPCRRWTRMYQR